MSYYADFTLGRLTLTEDFVLDEATDGDGRSITLSGQESWPPLANATAVRYRAEQLLAMDGLIVPLYLPVKEDRNGFYLVSKPKVKFFTADDVLSKADWSLNLVRLGNESDAIFESRLVGGARNSSYAASGASSERWHAPAAGHVGYYTGTTAASSMTRTGEFGSITVYRDVPADVSPQWGVTIDNWGAGAVEILMDGSVMCGLTNPNASMLWELNNGLVKLSARVGSGTWQLSNYVSSAWQTAKLWTAKVGTIGGTELALGEPSYINIVRNLPEECIVRLTYVTANGVSTLDLSLKRGSRFVSGFFQHQEATNFQILPTSTEAAMNSGAGYISATSNDARGNKYVTGSAVTMLIDTASGRIANSTTATSFGFFVGTVVGGTGAVSGDTAADVASQYLGTPVESTRVIRR